jgi:uncharacterized protein YdaU (DUF1376 family)
LGSDRFFFPFFWKDFMIATQGWTDEQVGAYLRLLIWAWDRDGLPTQEAEIQRLGQWKAAAWRRIWSVVGPKFEARDGRLVNVRQEHIRRVVGARSDSAKASAEARWAKDRADANAYADAMRTQCDGNANKEKQTSTPPPTPPHAEGRQTRAERKAALRAVGPSAGWRGGDGCPHEPRCSVPTHCALLIAKAEHPDEVPA